MRSRPGEVDPGGKRNQGGLGQGQGRTDAVMQNDAEQAVLRKCFKGHARTLC
jgi:hypothetical protein